MNGGPNRDMMVKRREQGRTVLWLWKRCDGRILESSRCDDRILEFKSIFVLFLLNLRYLAIHTWGGGNLKTTKPNLGVAQALSH